METVTKLFYTLCLKVIIASKHNNFYIYEDELKRMNEKRNNMKGKREELNHECW